MYQHVDFRISRRDHSDSYCIQHQRATCRFSVLSYQVPSGRNLAIHMHSDFRFDVAQDWLTYDSGRLDPMC